MRLINTKTLELETFHGSTTQLQYAILSHRWIGDEEVTFQDMQRPHRRWMPGWLKIQFCCEQARAEGLPYAWVDTCCIDKDSSAELSEAINSMYSWYSHATICYAYLNDVPDLSSNASLREPAEAITRSKWFTRSWTLQELIAPNHVVFFDAEFGRLGDKSDFVSEIEQATNIPASILSSPRGLPNYPIAVKMSWASRREATRTEDVAYSLFGLFEVNLPLLYGEGPRAFTRLQEEIIRQSNDHSIFLWHSQIVGSAISPTRPRRLPALAPSPENFKTCQDIVRCEMDRDTKPYAMTNVGLQIELPLFPYHLDTYVALLDCECKSQNGRYGILLAKDGINTARWYRTRTRDLDVVVVSAGTILKHSTWQKMHIMRGRTEEALITTDTKPSMVVKGSQPEMFYGIKINASSFLDWPMHLLRPYALVAYHDWGATPEVAPVKQNSEPEESADRSRSDSLLSPSSFKQFSLFYNQVVPTETILQAGLTSGHHRKQLASGSEVSKISRLHLRESTQSRSNHELPAVTVGTFEMPVMTTGTSGVVFFDRLVHGLRAVKVGLDFDFRPVVFLATHEADSGSQLENWMRQWRFKHIDEFNNSLYLQRDFTFEDTKHFWKLYPDMMRSQENLHIDSSHAGDAPVEIDKGVYSLRSVSSTNIDHWTVKPYKDETWHIAFTLEKRVADNLMGWELTMRRRDDIVAVNVQISCDD